MDFQRIQKFAENQQTPCLIIDLKRINEAYDRLVSSMPGTRIFYAIKACPMDEVITTIYGRGSNFDVASRPEIEQLLRLGIPGSRISYGNPIKTREEITFAFESGVKLYTCDSYEDLMDMAECAPGALINFRILLDGEGADWPLSRKFGCHPGMAFRLAIKARELGLVPYGIAFHVGSQQRDIGQWDTALTQVKSLFDALAKEQDIHLKCINIGGGFPAQYLKPTHSQEKYGSSVMDYLRDDFNIEDLDIIVEPGRSLAGDAGVICTKVKRVSKKSVNDDVRWLFLDIGRFGGLAETEGEAIRYPIHYPDYAHESGEDWDDVIIAGPTCDSADIMYQKELYAAPAGLKQGDFVYLLSTGAYTSSYSAVCFNGFPPLTTKVLAD
ncbi:MAG TPA: type III PLP-dependent enzyme [Candidatus Paceibacterota bacterium]|nr:type III PLP-dependent enzyme [Candidatus Paceibacterota bacterium]